MVFSVPILKHQTFFLQESTQNERIQLVPIDLGILCHIVPIYYTSKRAGNLKEHMMTHSGEKPHKCGQCEFASRLEFGLRRHMMVHSKDRPYQCDMCTYSCSRKEQLIQHTRTHTSEKTLAKFAKWLSYKENSF